VTLHGSDDMALVTIYIDTSERCIGFLSGGQKLKTRTDNRYACVSVNLALTKLTTLFSCQLTNYDLLNKITTVKARCNNLFACI